MPPEALRDALGAYLALHDALASDDPDAAAAHGRHLNHAVRMLELTGADASSLQTASSALASAASLEDIRHAFGHLSVPFARLVEASGVPDGLTLDRVRCGMAPDVPEQGIWLQRAGDLRNPYFGAAMLTCGRRTGTLAPSAASHAH